jgi:hypothetical protein
MKQNRPGESSNSTGAVQLPHRTWVAGGARLYDLGDRQQPVASAAELDLEVWAG